MDVVVMLSMLEDRDTSQAFTALKELELLSEASDILYTYIDKFIQMISSDKYVLRVRGFRLFCKQAKWDAYCKIDKSIKVALNILEDEKPTAVRQALAALHDLVRHKPQLACYVKERVVSIDCLRYKDTMRGLIARDIQSLLHVIEQNQKGHCNGY